MPDHFKRAEPVARAVRRVCRLHIGKALAHLRKASHPASIHCVRKEIKKLRAIFQLMRGAMSRSARRKIEKALHRAADRLAIPRDARVTLKAFEKLTGPEAAQRFPKIQKELQKNYRREARRFRDDDSVAEAKNILKKAGRRVGRLKIKPDGWTTFVLGMRQVYRCGRQTWQVVRQQPSPENFHKWRKHVKTLGHQFRLICPEWPAAVSTMADGLVRLGEQLGDDHDCFLLKQFIKEHSARQDTEATRLNELIASRQKKLRATALQLGARLYAEAPAVVCARLGTHWNVWRLKIARK